MTESTDATAPGDAIPEALNAAIGDIIARHENGFVTKWVALVETVDESGERGLWPCAGKDTKPWEVLGMLQHAQHLQLAQTLREGTEDE